MNNTPRGNRPHIVFYGKTNAGKSSLINKITNQEVSLVSDIGGTTTDPVSKSMELIPYGPVLLIDTGGLDDSGKLGKLRVEKTRKTLDKADLAIYVLDANNLHGTHYLEMKEAFKNRNIEYILVVNKADLIDEDEKKQILEEYGDLVFTSIEDEKSINDLKDKMIEKLRDRQEETSFLRDLVAYDGKVVLVVDNDSAAPKGRLILPQVQVIRDAIDNGIKVYVVRNSELKSSLEDLNYDVDLVITDSKIFNEVDIIVPDEIYMTSFSILMAREKGDLKEFVEGVKKIDDLVEKEDINILICESCSHVTTHEDIGKVKIPRMLKNYLEKDVNINFLNGEDFEVEDVDLVIHCGSCMLNKKTMETRIEKCRDKGIPITNYGIFIAYMLGILDRAIKIFDVA